MSCQPFSSCVNTNGKTHFHPKVHLSTNYSIHEAPIYTENVPIDVNFTINLRNILEVNEVAQLISMETSIRMFWIDFAINCSIYFTQLVLTSARGTFIFTYYTTSEEGFLDHEITLIVFYISCKFDRNFLKN